MSERNWETATASAGDQELHLKQTRTRVFNARVDKRRERNLCNQVVADIADKVCL